MPKQLINTVGLLVVLGLLAVTTFIVALPIYLQSLSTDDQTSSVAAQNANTQAQVDALSAQNLTSVQGDADTLRAQIPDQPRLDSVSALITSAATTTKVLVVSITPGTPIDASVPATGTPGETATTDTDAGQGATGAADAPTALSGQLSIPIEFQVTSPDLKSVLSFLDTLRAGPRLLGDIDVTFSSRGGVTSANVTANAFTATAGK